MKKLLVGCLCGWMFHVQSQTLTITNGVQTYGSLTNTTVTMSNRCELRFAATNPIPGCVNAWLFLTGVKPSVVAGSYLGQIFVSGAVAVADNNVRVVQYGAGTVVIPQPPPSQRTGIDAGWNEQLRPVAAEHRQQQQFYLCRVGIPPPVPPAPLNFSATAGDGQVALNGNAVTFATGYNVKRANASGGNYVANASVSTTSYIDAAVTNGTTYFYVVSAFNSGGESTNSIEAAARPVSLSAPALNFGMSADGQGLPFNWPADHTGWRLMMNTNNLGDASAWTPVTNTAGTRRGFL